MQLTRYRLFYLEGYQSRRKVCIACPGRQVRDCLSGFGGRKVNKNFVKLWRQGIVLCLVLFHAFSVQGLTNADDLWVSFVYDGDTLALKNGEKVRLIGIDCPEAWESDKLFKDARSSGKDAAFIKEMGRKAHQFTQDLVLNKKVRLEFDVERRDKYNRLLAYVYLYDGTFVNETVIREGYAYPLAIPPNVKYAEHFRALYQEARDNKKGLWK